MSEKILVNTGNSNYFIVLENSFIGLGNCLVNAGCRDKKVCIITDSNVSGFYLTVVYDIVSKISSRTHVFVFEAGEQSKNLDSVKDIYTLLIRHEFDRSDFLIALGGGVCGDLCGFTAATYLRGIEFIQIPTSLLAQVDSSIGGKTGVDFDSYKNMVGAFHMPRAVYVNISTLVSLPDREFSSGMGEIIKHGLIADRDYYDFLWNKREEIKKRDLNICGKMIFISENIKKNIVEQDPHESGIRSLLNFGHTLGHAIEKESDFSLSHGACVGLGMLAAVNISVSRGNLSMKTLDDLQNMLIAFDLPVKYNSSETESVIRDTENDKKMEAGKIKFILLESIGKAYIDKSVTKDEMRHALECIFI